MSSTVPGLAKLETSRIDRFLARPRRAVWTMALPMMAGTAVHTIYIVTDTAFVGTLSTEALAAVTFVVPLFMVMVTLTFGLGTAVTALVAQAVGRREPGGADAVAGTALSVGALLGIGLGAGGLVFGRPVLTLLGAAGHTHALALEYFQVLSLAVPMIFVSTTLRSVLVGEGDAGTPTVVMTATTALNLGLDAVFIFVVGLGVRGASLATAVASLCSLVAYWVLVFRRRDAFVRFRPAALVPSWPVAWRIAALGVPTAGAMLVMSLGTMAYNRVISEFGEVSVAAYGAASKVDTIVIMPIFGLASAAVSVVGMFAGAGRGDLVRSTVLYTYRWALVLATGIGVVSYLCSSWILVIFTRDPVALATGRTYLGFMVFAYPMIAFGMTTGRMLQGLGHGVPSMVITTARVFLVAVPAAYGAVYLLGAPVEAVWASILAGGLISTVVSVLWVRRLVWGRDPTTLARSVEPLRAVDATPAAVARE
jgi:putative MATE family efflux protein